MPFTPGHHAVELDDFDTLRRLLDQGADIQDPVHGGWTLLHHAVDGEIDVANQQDEPVHVDMTAFLLARGADPLAASEDGTTPLSFAQERGHWLAVELFNAWLRRNRTPAAS